MYLRFATTILLSLVAATASAQATRTEQKSFAVRDDATELRLDLPFGSLIKVTGWDKQEVAFTANININGGELNEAVSLTYQNDPDQLRIEMELDRDLIRNYSGTFTEEDCQEHGEGHGGHWNWEDGRSYFICQIITYEVKVPRGMKVKLETINNTVELRNLAGPLDIQTINGEVDLDWKASAAAEFRFESIHGELFSDLDLPTDGDKPGSFGLNYRTAWQGGRGPQVKLKTINGHIYVRRR